MSGFIEGENRQQSTLFPERLDEYVLEDNPVRVVDVFIDTLDLSGLGFQTEAKHTGRPGYHPSTMLKLYVYGYLNRIPSSRRLEREAQRNVELMWLLGRLSPDFKTIADFRKDNGEAIMQVCKQFVVLCRKLDLLTDTLVAIDGSKFKAVNNRDKNFTTAKMERRLKMIDESIERYLEQIAQADVENTRHAQTKKKHINEKIATLKEEMSRLKKIEARLANEPDGQISLTDPDARSMKTRGNGIVGYNVQTAVDTTHHLIVAFDVNNKGSDRAQLYPMACQAQEAMDTDTLNVVADRGYFSGNQILACAIDGIVTTIPKSNTSASPGKDQYDKRYFKYIVEDDEYECPAGERLIWRMRTEERGLELDRYWSSNCGNCSIKHSCTTARERRITRWAHEELVDEMQDRLDSDPAYMKARRQTVEHPFGTLKVWMGYTHFLMKRLENVNTEMSLNVLAYNIKRVISIMGVESLIAAIAALTASISFQFRLVCDPTQRVFERKKQCGVFDLE